MFKLLYFKKVTRVHRKVSAQATVEYILMLAVIVIMFLAIKKVLVAYSTKAFGPDAFKAKFNVLFDVNEDNLHRFRFPRTRR